MVLGHVWYHVPHSPGEPTDGASSPGALPKQEVTRHTLSCFPGPHLNTEHIHNSNKIFSWSEKLQGRAQDWGSRGHSSTLPQGSPTEGAGNLPNYPNGGGSRLLCDFYILWVKYSQVAARSRFLVMEENSGTVVGSLWQLPSWVTPQFVSLL